MHRGKFKKVDEGKQPKARYYLRVAYSTSPGIGPIISCCRAGHRGSGVGQPDLNQYFPLPCLFVIATNESSGTSSRLGFACMLLVLVAGDVAVMVLMLFLLDSSR